MVFLKKRKIQKLAEKSDALGLFKIVYGEKDAEVSQLAAVTLGNLNSDTAIKLLETALNEETHTFREAAVRTLFHSRHHQTRTLLTRALRDSQTNIRKIAALALGKLNDPQTIEPLLNLVRHHNDDEYIQALESLVHLGKTMPHDERQSRIITPLEQIVAETRVQGADKGAETLEWMGWSPDVSFQPPSEQAIREHNASLRAAILDAVVAMGWTPDTSSLAAEYWVMRGDFERCERIGEPAIDLLVTLLKHGDETERQKAYLALVNIGAPASERLIAALQDDITDMRQAAFKALAKLGPAAIPQIIAALKDEYADIRQAAVRELGKLGDPIAIGPIIDAFGDIEPVVRREAQHAILQIGPPAIDTLLSALRHNSNQEIRWAAARTLESMGWKPSHDELGAAYWIVQGQWEQCVQIGMPAVSTLLEQLDHWDEEICANALKTILRIGPHAIGRLIPFLKDVSADVRARSVVLLEESVEAELPLDHAERLMLVLLEDEEDEEVQQHLFRILKTVRSRKKKGERVKQHASVRDTTVQRRLVVSPATTPLAAAPSSTELRHGQEHHERKKAGPTSSVARSVSGMALLNSQTTSQQPATVLVATATTKRL